MTLFTINKSAVREGPSFLRCEKCHIDIPVTEIDENGFHMHCGGKISGDMSIITPQSISFIIHKEHATKPRNSKPVIGFVPGVGVQSCRYSNKRGWTSCITGNVVNVTEWLELK